MSIPSNAIKTQRPTNLSWEVRLVEKAGGRRFIKGVTGDEMECWRRVCEGLEACREDIASGEERLTQDVYRYERLLAVANEKLAAEEVCKNSLTKIRGCA